MGNRNNEIRGLLKRTADHYNNKLFSDLTFRVRDTDGEYKLFYAHKLILAMAGEIFAKSCYNSTVGPSHIIKITDVTPYIVDLMLKYVYTDKIKFGSLGDAMNVLKLAKRYGIRDLIGECNFYISQFQVDNNSVCAKYDIALVYQNRKLLGACRRLISSETKSVFESAYFCDASQNVIEDILKLDKFSLSSELEVIEAALRWCKAECVRKKRPSNAELCIRDSFLPLCRNLRFLSLEIQEFFDFEERNKIFTSLESSGLTENILNKDNPKLIVPTGFCKFRASRCCNLMRNSIQNTFQHETNNKAKEQSVMSYEFPLREIQKEIGSCSDNDVKCHTNFKMTRGTITIHEIELRVKDLQKADEEIEVHLCFTNNSGQTSYSKTVQLRNSVLQLPLNDPIVATPANPLDIEVMVEGLKLNRCSVCRSQESRCKVNCGLNVTAEIDLRSNQSNGTDSFFFLISKILYSIPKYN